MGSHFQDRNVESVDYHARGPDRHGIHLTSSPDDGSLALFSIPTELLVVSTGNLRDWTVTLCIRNCKLALIKRQRSLILPCQFYQIERASSAELVVVYAMAVGFIVQYSFGLAQKMKEIDSNLEDHQYPSSWYVGDIWKVICLRSGSWTHAWSPKPSRTSLWRLRCVWHRYFFMGSKACFRVSFAFRVMTCSSSLSC